MLFLTSVHSQTSCAADLRWKLVLKHTNLSTYLPGPLEKGKVQGGLWWEVQNFKAQRFFFIAGVGSAHHPALHSVLEWTE